MEPRIEEAEKRVLFKESVEVIKGNSVAGDVLERIRARVIGKKVLVTLDSNHRKSHVQEELRLYSDLVSKGSYLIVQDTFMNGHPVMPKYGDGPMEALEEFIKRDKRFVIDRSREKYLLTFYPKGYLKRIK